MAIARPVRALALAAALMWCFIIWQIFSPSAPISRPGGAAIYEPDPNLEREPSVSSLHSLRCQSRYALCRRLADAMTD